MKYKESDIKLISGKGSKDRGGDKLGSYWHIYCGEKRAGYIYINYINELPLGYHYSMSIELNLATRGKGIGAIAYKKAVLLSGLPKVYLHMRKSNIASRKAAENVGFKVLDMPDIRQLVMLWEK